MSRDTKITILKLAEADCSISQKERLLTSLYLWQGPTYRIWLYWGLGSWHYHPQIVHGGLNVIKPRGFPSLWHRDSLTLKAVLTCKKENMELMLLRVGLHLLDLLIPIQNTVWLMSSTVGINGTSMLPGHVTWRVNQESGLGSCKQGCTSRYDR